MRLIYIVNARIPTEKAHGYQIVKMCEEFAKIGCEVELVVPSRNNYIKQDLFQYYGIKRNFKFRIIKSTDFLKYDRIIGKAGLYLQWLFFIIKMLFIKINKDTLVYTRDQGAVWALSLRGHKVCYECHGWFQKKTKFILYLLRKADFIIATNNFIKNEFIKNNFAPEKFLVAPNGINLPIFDISVTREDAISRLNLKIAEDKKILLYTGSFKTMAFEKGISNILEALKILWEKNLVFFAVGGSPLDIEYYSNLAENLGVADQAYFLPRQTQEKLAIFQKAADILLMPFPKIAHYEYFMVPLKMFEYMAGKRLIIASDLPSIKEVLNNNNCIFCQPGDVEDLAKKIKQALNNPALGGKLVDQAYQDVLQYSWDKRAKKILEFISS